MKALAIDVETTGFAKTTKPPAHPEQPEIVSIGLVLTNDDNPIAEYYSVVQHISPSQPAAEEIHGISCAYAAEHGVSKEHAAEMLMHFLNRADLLVAHNLNFDRFMAMCLMSQVAGDYDPIESAPGFCTMNAAKSIPYMNATNLPYVYNQLCGLFAMDHEAHRAIDDARACSMIFRAMVSKGYGPVV